MRGKRGILCLMLAAAVLLSGCSNLMLFEAQSVRNVELPDVSGEEYVAPWGDSQADYLERTGLYYVNEDAQQLTRSEISYLLTPAEDQAVTILNRLLGETPDDMTAVAPEGTRLLGVEVTGNIATVNLSLEARGAQSDQQLLWLYAAIANTLTELDDVDGVNILINGRQEAILSLPMGVMTQSDGDLAALWAQQQADAQRAQVSEVSSMDRVGAVVFPCQRRGMVCGGSRGIDLCGWQLCHYAASRAFAARARSERAAGSQCGERARFHAFGAGYGRRISFFAAGFH